jgi:hypothetical protein
MDESLDKLTESSMRLNVLGVGFSMREASYGTAALKLTLDLVKTDGGEMHLLDLRQTNLPMLY